MRALAQDSHPTIFTQHAVVSRTAEEVCCLKFKQRLLLGLGAKRGPLREVAMTAIVCQDCERGAGQSLRSVRKMPGDSPTARERLGIVSPRVDAQRPKLRSETGQSYALTG